MNDLKLEKFFDCKVVFRLTHVSNLFMNCTAAFLLHILKVSAVKVARYSFSGSIPTKFEHKLRYQKQRFGKIATTVVLDKDENLL